MKNIKLKDIDKVYGMMHAGMSVSRKLRYCIELIDLTANVLRSGSLCMTPLTENESASIILAARREIQMLATQPDSH
jgi:hypothetical protein